MQDDETRVARLLGHALPDALVERSATDEGGLAVRTDDSRWFELRITER